MCNLYSRVDLSAALAHVGEREAPSRLPMGGAMNSIADGRRQIRVIHGTPALWRSMTLACRSSIRRPGIFRSARGFHAICALSEVILYF